MKDIMARQSSAANQDVPSLTYNPADKRCLKLFEGTHPLHDLERMRLKDVAGRSLSWPTLYEEHRVGKPSMLKHDRDVLRTLEPAGHITTAPPAARRPTRTGEGTMRGRRPRRFAGRLARKK